MKWRSLPERFGSWWRAAQLHIRWSKAGVWERAFAHLRDVGRPDLAEVFLDGTSVRAHQKAAGCKGGMKRHRLGRSRGGYGTKAVAACDARGLALSFALLCGQASEPKAAPDLLDAVCAMGAPGRVVCDRAYSARDRRGRIEAAGTEPCVPANKTHPPVPYDATAYKRRRHVENLWARLKENRALAMRYEKTATSYVGNLLLAASLDWLSNGP